MSVRNKEVLSSPGLCVVMIALVITPEGLPLAHGLSNTAITRASAASLASASTITRRPLLTTICRRSSFILADVLVKPVEIFGRKRALTS